MGEPPRPRTSLEADEVIEMLFAAVWGPRFAQNVHRVKIISETRTRKAGKPSPDFLVHRSRLGGIARGRKLSAERLSEIGRAATNERWRRYRERQVAISSQASPRRLVRAQGTQSV